MIAAPRKKQTWMGTRCFSEHGRVVLRGIAEKSIGASECENDRSTSQKRDLDGDPLYRIRMEHGCPMMLAGHDKPRKTRDDDLARHISRQ